jgi:hypothetical protein
VTVSVSRERRERLGMTLAMGSHLSAGERGEVGYRFGRGVAGPRAGFLSGPIRFPGSISIFIFFSSFLFSDFLFLS